MSETVSGIFNVLIWATDSLVLAGVVVKNLPARYERLPRTIDLCLFGAGYILLCWLLDMTAEAIQFELFATYSLKALVLTQLLLGLVAVMFKGDLLLRIFLVCCFWAVREISIFMAIGVQRTFSQICLELGAFQNITNAENAVRNIQIWVNTGLLLMCAVYCVTLFMALRAIVRQLKPVSLRKQEFWYLMLPCLVGVAVTWLLQMALLLDEGMALAQSMLYNVLLPLAGMLMLLMHVAAVRLYREVDRLHTEDADKRVLEKQVAGLHEHVREVETVYGEVRGLRHDMAGHLQNIRVLMAQPEPRRTDLDKYLCQMESQLEALQMPYVTGNPITDVILRQKSIEARAIGAAFEAGFTFPAELGIDAYDMAVILGNALDNALEACANMQDGARDIQLRTRTKGRMFFVEVENSFNGDIRFEGDMPVSSKPEVTLHGMGLSNIRRCAEKYMGDIQIQLPDAGRRFRLIVMLQGKNPSL